MSRRFSLWIVAVVVLAIVGAFAWTVLRWPPPRLVLKYGIPPFCRPTGRVVQAEGIVFVEIGPGCFRMGSDYLAERGDFLRRLCGKLGLPWGDQPKPSYEMPVHWVEFERGFWIAKTEITNEQYERFDANHKRSESSPGDRHPVVDVSWEDANAFCAWLSNRSGRVVRLPSEAEWEASCRSGSETEYCFGEWKEGLADYAWFDSNSKGSAHEVAARRASRWGLFDLHGNAGEWCGDTYHKNYEGAPRDGSPWTEGGEAFFLDLPDRVYRGGCYAAPGQLCRSASRVGVAGFEANYIGFRPAFTLPE